MFTTAGNRAGRRNLSSTPPLCAKFRSNTVLLRTNGKWGLVIRGKDSFPADLLLEVPSNNANQRVVQLTNNTNKIHLRLRDDSGTISQSFLVGDLSNGATGLGVTSPTAFVHVKAGTTAIPSMQIDAGALMTTPSDGAIEMDADCMYGCTDAGNRGVIPLVHYVCAPSGGYTLTSSASEQALFPGVGGTAGIVDTLTLETGLYFCDFLVALSSMSATSGNAAWDILGAGTATITRLDRISAIDATLATIAAQSSAFNTAQTAAAMATATTATVMGFWGTGVFRVTAAGTIIPSITLATAAAANVNENSYFRCWRVGSSTAQAVGQWT